MAANVLKGIVKIVPMSTVFFACDLQTRISLYSDVHARIEFHENI